MYPPAVPELPDVTVYVEAIEARCRDQVLESIRVAGPSLLRTAEPPLPEAFGRRVTGLRRMGKRIVFALEDDLFLVVHLMIAGRFHWKKPGFPLARKRVLAAFDFA